MQTGFPKVSGEWYIYIHLLHAVSDLKGCDLWHLERDSGSATQAVETFSLSTASIRIIHVGFTSNFRYTTSAIYAPFILNENHNNVALQQQT